MKAVIQRVKSAEVLVKNKPYSKINYGYLILIGFHENDNEELVKKMADKIANLRIIADSQGKMNFNINQIKGEILLVSQFTLIADTSQRRPSFIKAMKPIKAEKLYNYLIKLLKEKNINVKTGKFGEYMEIKLINDGPVTIVIDI